MLWIKGLVKGTIIKEVVMYKYLRVGQNERRQGHLFCRCRQTLQPRTKTLVLASSHSLCDARAIPSRYHCDTPAILRRLQLRTRREHEVAVWRSCEVVLERRLDRSHSTRRRPHRDPASRVREHRRSRESGRGREEAAAMEAVDTVVRPVKDFAKDSIRLVKRCHKPDRREFSKVATRTALGFIVMGFIGFFVKLIFIPINNIIVGTA